MGRTLGEGTFAEVKLGVADDGTQWAVKEIDISKSVNPDIALKTLHWEIEAAKVLSQPGSEHENVIKYGLFSEKMGSQVGDVAYITQEVIEGGALYDYIALGRFEESLCKQLFR